MKKSKALNTHYKQTKIEPFQVIDDWGLDFYLGNVLKYIQRHTRKGTAMQDVDKAIDYLNEYKRRIK